MRLYEDVIYYQGLMITLLETQYAKEVGQVRKESMKELSRQFYEGQLFVDQLTGAKNRNFYEHLLSKQQRVKNYTIVVLDIDRFKKINDTYGHTLGDEAIKFVASHLLKWTPKHDISIVRYGGDEFILLIPYRYEEFRESIQQLHDKILTTPFYIQKQMKQSICLLVWASAIPTTITIQSATYLKMRIQPFTRRKRRAQQSFQWHACKNNPFDSMNCRRGRLC